VSVNSPNRLPFGIHDRATCTRVRAREGELTSSSAHTITLALDRFGVIKIVSKGKAGLNSRKAAQFRYLLPQTENGAPQTQNGCHVSKDQKGGNADDCHF
jgi:hypothetical protein